MHEPRSALQQLASGRNAEGTQIDDEEEEEDDDDEDHADFWLNLGMTDQLTND